MDKQSKKEYDKKWYQKHRDEILAKRSAKYSTEYRREWLAAHPEKHEKYKARRREYWAKHNTEEFRAKRRAEYAAKHANDPMTEHRRRCIEAQQERMGKPLAQRKVELMELKAKEQAMKDIRAEQQKESNDQFVERMTEKLMKQFYEHATGKRKCNVTIYLHRNDNSYFMRRAVEYHKLGEKLTTVDPLKDYTERNMIVHKRNVIWQEFEDLYKKYYHNKSMSE